MRPIVIALVVLLVVPVAAPTAAWTPQDGAFLEPHGGAGGRTAHVGVHPAGGAIAWATPDLGDLDGPLQLTRDGQIIAYVETGVAQWDLLLIDAADGSTNARVEDVVGGCAVVAGDGTIWVQDEDVDQLHAVSPSDGSITRSVSSPVGRCQGTIQLLPDDRLALSNSCCRERIAIVDLDTGDSELIPDEPVTEDVFLTSPDGLRGYVVTLGSPRELLSLDLPGGAVLDRLELPGGLGVSAYQRSIVMPGGEIVLVSGDSLLAIEDDGTGGLTQRWEIQETDDAGPTPATLYPVGDDVVAGWQAIGAADTLLGVRLSDGEVLFRTPSPPGPSGGIASRSGLSDADGNVILPQIISRTLDGVDYLYDVFDADGLPVGTSPPDLGSGVGGMALGEDGTLYLRTTRDEGEVVVAVRAGEAGLVDIPTTVRPDEVGAAYASVTVDGSVVVRADQLVLRGGGDVRRADPIATDGVPYRRTGRFNLTGAEPGTWQVAVDVDGIITDTGATIEVVEPDDKVALDLRLEMPAAVRNGRRGAVTLTVVNRSNIDGIGVPVVVQADLNRNDPRRLLPAFDVDVSGGDVPDLRPPEVNQAGNATRVVFVALDHVPAHGARRLPFVLDVPDDAPPEGTVTVRAAVPECHAEEGVTFSGGAPDPCIANAVRGAGEGALGSVSSGTRNCLAMGLANLITPTLNPDGTVMVPGRPSGTDVGGVVRDCLQGAIVEAGGSGFGPLAVLQYEGLLHSIAIGYLDCRLGEATAGTGADGDGSGSGLGPGYGSGSTTSGSSVDPNEIQGPPGTGEPRWVSASEPFGYRILFENLPGAAFAAQTVTITTTVPEGLDPTTVSFGEVGFGGSTYAVPPEPGTTLLTPEAADHRVLVTVARDGAQLAWSFETLALTAAGPPSDDTIGFLPPNDAPPEGDGHVTFTVGGAPADGAVLDAQAEITFDTNPPIVTNVWSNTVDDTPPTSGLGPRPDLPSASNTVPLSWTAEDAVSGVATSLLTTTVEATTATRSLPDPTRDATVVGPRGATVEVSLRAVDGAGNVQRPAVTDTVTIAVDALDRLAGATRIHTAVAIAEAVFDAAPVVVLARADTYPDSLAGAAAAHGLDAPILLTNPDELPGVVIDALRRLDTGSVLLLGGTAAIGEPVEGQLAALGIATERVAGPTRYGTAAAIAGLLPGSPRRAFVAEGGNADPRLGWPEALVTAPWAARSGAPLLLVESDRLPEETADAINDLGADTIVVVGGPARVSPQVVDQIAALGVDVERVGADDRYQTSLDVATAAAADGSLGPASTWVATGEVFADALAAGAAAAATGGQLLLVHAEDPAVSAQVTDAIARDAAGIRHLRLAGGTAAVSPTVEEAIRAALR